MPAEPLTLKKLLIFSLFSAPAAVAKLVTFTKPGGPNSTLDLTTCKNTVRLQGPFEVTFDSEKTCVMGNGEMVDRCSGEISHVATPVTQGFTGTNATSPYSTTSLFLQKQVMLQEICGDGIQLLKKIQVPLNKPIKKEWLQITLDGKVIDTNSGTVLKRLKEGTDFVKIPKAEENAGRRYGREL